MVLSSLPNYETVPMPEVLASLTGRTGNITLAFREKLGQSGQQRSKSVSRQSVSEQEGKENVEEDLDLTGSPLGADFDPDQKWEVFCPAVDTEDGGRETVGPQYSGLSLAQARGWLSAVSGPGERWAVTDGADREATRYLGRVTDEATVSLARVLAFPPDTHRAVSAELGRVTTLHRRAGGDSAARQEATAEFCLVGGPGLHTSSLTVRSSWARVSSLLEAPPLYADTKIEASIVGGDDKLATSQLWSELQLLAGFVRGLSGEGEGVTWLGSEEEKDVETIVQDLLETVRQTGPRTGVTKLEAETIVDQEAEPFSLKERQEVDFTDLLWTNLYRVTSYSQLTEAFRLLFTRIMAEEIRPFVYARNKSQVVKVINNIVRGGESLPDLTGHLPLEMLIECGLEKLKRDYSHTLLNSELASQENISQFLMFDNHAGAVQSLYSLHIVVELAFLLQTFLHLSPDVLRSLIGSALADPASSGGSGGSRRDFHFSVPTQALQQLGDLRPDTWTLRLSSAITNSCLARAVETAVRISQEAQADSGEEEEEEETKFRMFVCNSITRAVMK